MVRLGFDQLARRLALVLTGLALVGYIGYLLSDLYRSRNELDRLRQEELLRESGRRALALEYFLSERSGDLQSLAEDRALQAYFENKALGMSMEYGLGASLYGLREAMAGLQQKRRLGEATIYRRLVFLDDGLQVLADVQAPGARFTPGADEHAAWAPLLGTPGEPPRLRPLGNYLVVSLAYRFRADQGGHLLAWVSTDEVVRRFVGEEAGGSRTSLLLWQGAPLPGQAVGRVLPPRLVAAGAALASGAGSRLAAEQDGGQGWLAQRNALEGTHLSLLTLIPEAALDRLSPRLVLALTAALGLLVVLAGAASLLAHRRALRELELLVETLPFAVVVVTRARAMVLANAEARRFLSLPARLLEGLDWGRFVEGGAVAPGAGPQEVLATPGEGPRRPILLAEVPVVLGGERLLVEAFLDLSERKRLEAQLQQAQKLEAVGQLAAGIAHELNTPVQFVGDSVRFLQEGFAALGGLLATYRGAVPALAREAGRPELVRELAAADEEADLAYLEENAPAAFARTLDGVSRVATIVGAMKEFAHPDQRQKLPADLNRALLTTLTIARNEYRYVADVETDLGALPPVSCHLGALNQVFVNLLVNAAHAVADKVHAGGERGLIRVRSAREGDLVRIDFEDTGVGIPEGIRSRIFDPFFTTKEVGRGTGQGLAIARSIVVDRHGGTLSFESEVGKGSTFTVRLPTGGGAPAPAEGAGAAAARLAKLGAGP